MWGCSIVCRCKRALHCRTAPQPQGAHRCCAAPCPPGSESITVTGLSIEAVKTRSNNIPNIYNEPTNADGHCALLGAASGKPAVGCGMWRLRAQLSATTRLPPQPHLQGAWA